MNIDLAQFHQTFFEETVEHLAALEQLLVTLDLAAPDAEALNGIFRAAHSIKGGAGMFGFSDMADVTHILETLLDKWRSGALAVRADMVDAVLEARDLLARQLEHHRDGAPFDDAEREVAVELCQRLQQLAASAIPINQDENDGWGLFGSPAAPAAEPEGYGFFDDPPVPAPAPAVPAPVAEKRQPEKHAAVESSSIRVSVEKTDHLINLVGELVITQAMLEQLGEALDPVEHERIQQALVQLQRNTRELQETAMSLRMLPIGSVFSRFPRLVRDLAGKLGKQVELVLEGEATELDKGLVEKLADPLTHIVRNSIDHGIELPAARTEAGKPAHGTIALRAFHQSGSIVIEVVDDGHGLNRDKIIDKARSRGLYISDDATDAEVWQLIFEPGFSTADAVTDISGRGVGMDVVRRNIAAMSGRIELESKWGEGTRIIIRLPLTLAILDGLLVAVGGETYVIPLACITESVQAEADSIATVAGQGRVVRVRGEYLVLVSLQELFNLPVSNADAGRIVILLESAGRHFALQVDELVGQSQVVIKSLETNYRRVPGCAGATILGDGRVAMILDVEALLQMSQQAR